MARRRPGQAPAPVAPSARNPHGPASTRAGPRPSRPRRPSPAWPARPAQARVRPPAPRCGPARRRPRSVLPRPGRVPSPTPAQARAHPVRRSPPVISLMSAGRGDTMSEKCFVLEKAPDLHPFPTRSTFLTQELFALVTYITLGTQLRAMTGPWGSMRGRDMRRRAVGPVVGGRAAGIGIARRSLSIYR